MTGVDIAPGMLAAAEALSAGQAPSPSYRRAAVEELPFEDGSLDGVISTYGVIFSNAPCQAAKEMARVLRAGGRLALATWADSADGYNARFFAMLETWSEAPPPAASPFDWGNSRWLNQALGDLFDVRILEQTTTLYAPDLATVWMEYVNGFGPVAATYSALPSDQRGALKAAFEDLHRPHASEFGVVIPRQALIVRGVRV